MTTMIIRMCDWRGEEIDRAEIDLPEIADGYAFAWLPIAQAAANEAARRGEIVKLCGDDGSVGHICPSVPRRSDGTAFVRWHYSEQE